MTVMVLTRVPTSRPAMDEGWKRRDSTDLRLTWAGSEWGEVTTLRSAVRRSSVHLGDHRRSRQATVDFALRGGDGVAVTPWVKLLADQVLRVGGGNPPVFLLRRSQARIAVHRVERAVAQLLRQG